MLGYAAILVSFLATAVAILFYLKTSLKSPMADNKTGRLFYRISALMLTIASGYLYYVIFSDNFHYTYVYNYSSRAQAWMYKLSAFWAGQEGSFLLWAFFHSLLGLRLSKKNMPIAMVSYCCLQLCIVFVLLVKSPFTPLSPLQQDGMGLNPLLQDPWMVIHPPIVFLGYAILALPFALAIQGMFSREHKKIVSHMLPWTLVAFASLGAGIFIGGFWAYKVLGWGGYWAWDPVENSSLVPWLITGTLIHLVLLAKTKESAAKWVYLTAVINFTLVLYGTYLTRSGVLNDFSTHSFSDEGTGTLLASFVVVTLVGALITLFFRWDKLPDGSLYHRIQSRECCVIMAAVLLGVLGLLVFIGMSTPLISAFMGSPHTVSMSFYNDSCLPLITAMLIALTIGSMFPWGQGSSFSVSSYWWLGVVALIGMVLAITLKLSGILAILTAGFGVSAIAATSWTLWNKRISGPAGLTHIGLAVALVGILFSSLATQSDNASFDIGKRQDVMGLGLTYLGKQTDAMGNGFYHQFKLDGSEQVDVRPFTKQNQKGQSVVHEPGIYRQLMSDIYVAPIVHENSGQTFDLTKEDEITAGDLQIKFIRLAMDKSPDSDEIKAYALMQVIKDNVVQESKPAMMQKNGQMSSLPVTVFDHYEMSLVSLNMSKGQIVLNVKDTAQPVTENLEAQVSIKPLMNLVWLGSFLITIGSTWAALKRYQFMQGGRL